MRLGQGVLTKFAQGSRIATVGPMGGNRGPHSAYFTESRAASGSNPEKSTPVARRVRKARGLMQTAQPPGESCEI
jgi:hypothetical protein